jgi:hypothetical protein
MQDVEEAMGSRVHKNDGKEDKNATTKELSECTQPDESETVGDT